MFGKLFKGIGTVAKAIAPVAIAAAAPEALINNAVAAVVKHATKIDNQAIPGLNVVLSSGAAFVRNGVTSGNWGVEGIIPAVIEGAGLAGASTAIHQTAKINAKKFTTKSI